MVKTGQTYGRWTVLDRTEKNEKGEIKWLCRCECGTERFVRERALKHNESLSCGCLRKENATKAVSEDLTGRIFGDLTVLYKSEKRVHGNVIWVCRCSCGEIYETTASLLIRGRRIRCGSIKHRKNYAFSDITGMRFNKLTALYPTKKRDRKGSVVWRCRCDCGQETDVSYNNLMYSDIRSCGCQKTAHDKNLKNYLTHTGGTSLDAIRSKKLPADNTTGYKGVYLIKGKYVAKIVFQRKAYYLGNYDDINDAVKARREAEELLFEETVAFYERWKQKADIDPVWAEQNPVKINVTKDAANKLSVEFLPYI